MGSSGMNAGLAMLVVLLGASSVPAAGREAATGTALKAERHGETFVVEGGFEVDQDAGSVWSVLSDYEGIGRFVPSMRRSVVRSRGKRGVRVEQTAVAQVLFLSREMRLVLDIAEEPGRRLSFVDVSGQDFSLYRGEWSLVEAGGRTRVAYRLEAVPREGVPGFIGMPVLKGIASDLLARVRAEVVRRGEQERAKAKRLEAVRLQAGLGEER